MNIPSFEFLGFAAIVALLLQLSRRPLWRQSVLIVANCAFILSFKNGPLELAPFAGFVILGFLIVKALERDRRIGLFTLSLAAIVVCFCWLKRYTIIPVQLNLPWAYSTVGMSYVFFRITHLAVDAYQGSQQERIGILSYLNYTLNFTSLISGPIQYYEDFLATAKTHPLRLDSAAAGSAATRIITGFFKVSIVSQALFIAQGHAIGVFSTGEIAQTRIMGGALVLALFPLYLYFNFSGYTDFVIGVARFLGMQLPENFNRPFMATGFLDFWNRWHMSLANWFKLYVYGPLLKALMRHYPAPRFQLWLGVTAYFITFFLVGFWHGQTAMFLWLGVLLGFGVSANKCYQVLLTQQLGRIRYRELCANPLYAALSRGLTYLWFAVCLLWFWATSEQLRTFASKISLAEATAIGACVWSTATVLLAALKFLGDRGLEQRKFASSIYLKTAWLTALAVLLLSGTVVLNAPAPHIVYKGF